MRKVLKCVSKTVELLTLVNVLFSFYCEALIGL